MGRLLLVGRVVLLMWGELSYECGVSCLGVSFIWGDLSWGKFPCKLAVLFTLFCSQMRIFAVYFCRFQTEIEQ